VIELEGSDIASSISEVTRALRSTSSDRRGYTSFSEEEPISCAAGSRSFVFMSQQADVAVGDETTSSGHTKSSSRPNLISTAQRDASLSWKGAISTVRKATRGG
jgi:hypothetical protein